LENKDILANNGNFVEILKGRYFSYRRPKFSAVKTGGWYMMLPQNNFHNS